MFFVLALAIVFVSRCAPSGVSSYPIASYRHLLASTFLGRSPQTLGTTGATLKALLTLWLFGTLIVGLYLQSHITADVYAPSFSREVEDINEFEKLLEANRVLSCLEFTFFTTALVHIKIPFIKKLGSIIKDRPYDFIPLGEQNGCDRRVRLGGHVHVRPCCSYDEYIAFQQGLAKGRGSFQMYHRVATMLSNLPQRRQHHRLLLAISESGMDYHYKRNVGLVHFNEGKILIPRSFSSFMWLFATGCISAMLVLFFECVSFRVFGNGNFNCGS
ncbi:hypothetical protein HPB48_000518 [Haemaphysalis longicornis]|uniref:Ionotropic receptor n=1 Tax=Haemaphysalis longicornis TaxID=44386 RepID=A0A9J6GD93_HAELO|nr:hypothetical protein HPB48_000518 [Haemaphysalis longicornis]